MSVDVTAPRFNGPQADQFEKHPSFGGDATLALDSNQWNSVFVLSPDDGEGVILGRGQSRNPREAQGYIGAHLMNNDPNADGSAEQILGSYRITVVTANNGTHVTTLDSGSLSNIDTYDRNGNKKSEENLQPLPQTDDEFTTKEYEIHFEVQPNSDTTLSTSPASGETEFFADGYQAERVA